MNSKKNRFSYLALILFLAVCNIAEAQFYLTGDDPSRARWNQIKSSNYIVIYPQGTDSLAKRYAWLLESERGRVMAGVMADPKRVPVVLNPYTMASNGMVVWAPKRMELYTIPPANGAYYQNWERQLVLHESRHVGQMSHFTKGIYRPLSWLLGEQITGLGVGIFASKWLLEGDAVVAETELTDGGRGRSASFLEYYRASFLLGEYRNWYKWKYGGYKHYTPDVYAFGYIINSTARIKSDNYLYAGELLNAYVKKFYNFNIVNAASKKITGARPRDLFKEGVALYSEIWKRDFESRAPYTKPEGISHKSGKYYYEYRSPVVVGRDSIICIKYSYDNPAALVMLGDGEKLIRQFSSSVSNFERGKDKIYWTETIPDIRWGKESFNNLYSYNFKLDKIEKLSGKSAYNNPRISNSGDTLSVVEYPFGGGSNIVLLNAETGGKIASYPAPLNGQLTESAWIGENLYALVITDKGLGMFLMDMSVPGIWHSVIEEQPGAIRSLRAANGLLYFESDIDGVNNVYQFNPSTEELIRVVNSKFGAHDPYITGNRVFYSDLNTDGIKPVVAECGNGCEKRENDVFVKDRKILNTYKYEVADKLSSQANHYFAEYGKNNVLSNDDTSFCKDAFQVKRYRKGTHLFRFHSWAPIYYNVDKIMDMSYDHFYELVSLGATVYSQNTLGTAVTMLGYSYNKGYHAAHASFEYSGLFPVFKIEADYNTDDRYKVRIDRGEKEIKLSVMPTGEPLLNLSALVYVPLNLSSHGWQRGLIPQAVWQYENNLFYNGKKEKYINRHQVNYALQYYQMRPVAHSAIYPKWGFSATLKGAFSPDESEYFGSAFSIYSYLYVPGFMKRQGIRLSATYQKQCVDGKYMYLSNLVSMPRGHDDYYGTNYYKFSVDYAVPINLSGLNIGFLAYLKRLQIVPFADLAGIKDSHESGYSKLTSYGCDLLLDAVICHIGIPFSFGLRYARTNAPGQLNHIGFLSSISLF